jgi:hypothetical protein
MGKQSGGGKLKGASKKGVELVMEPVRNIESRSAQNPVPGKVVVVKKAKKNGKGKKGNKKDKKKE